MPVTGFKVFAVAAAFKSTKNINKVLHCISNSGKHAAATNAVASSVDDYVGRGRDTQRRRRKFLKLIYSLVIVREEKSGANK